MALIAERWGLIPELRSFTGAQKPVWGTCAGLIFLANRATGALLAQWLIAPMSQLLMTKHLIASHSVRRHIRTSILWHPTCDSAVASASLVRRASESCQLQRQA